MIWKAATSESGALGHLTLVWLALTTTLVFGVLTVRASAPAGAQFRLIGLDLIAAPSPSAASTTTTTSDLASPAGPFIADSADSSESGRGGPSVVYAGVQWSLQEARFVSVTASSDGYPVIIAELDLTNTTQNQVLRVRKSDLALIWSDGQRFGLDRFDQLRGARSFSLEPGEFRSVTAVFKPRVLTDPAVEETMLQIGSPGRIPAYIPLVGPMPRSIFPVAGSLADDDATVVDDLDRGEGLLVITPRRAALGLNAGPYRAATGSRLVLVEVSVQRAETYDTPSFVQKDFWRLTVDGTPIAPGQVYRSSTDSSNEELITLVFVVPEEFSDASLEVADGSGAYAIDFAEVFPED